MSGQKYKLMINVSIYEEGGMHGRLEIREEFQLKNGMDFLTMAALLGRLKDVAELHTMEGTQVNPKCARCLNMKIWNVTSEKFVCSYCRSMGHSQD